jgi:hypothetical protein
MMNDYLNSLCSARAKKQTCTLESQVWETLWQTHTAVEETILYGACMSTTAYCMCMSNALFLSKGLVVYFNFVGLSELSASQHVIMAILYFYSRNHEWNVDLHTTPHTRKLIWHPCHWLSALEKRLLFFFISKELIVSMPRCIEYRI